MRTITLAAIGLFALTALTPAYADGPALTAVDCGNTPHGTVITCFVDKDGKVVTVSDGSQTIGGQGTSRAAGPAYVAYQRIVYLPDGGFCVTTGYHEVGVTPIDGVENAPGAHVGGNGFNNNFDLAPCPSSPSDPGTAAVSAASIAEHYWRQTRVPSPAPKIAPGRAITGKLAYLETRGELTHTYTEETFVGQLTILAQGSYMIDWGDGFRSGPFSVEGGPWPDGKIAHEYIAVGTYNVTVTEDWTATWQLGGESGVLDTLQASGTISNFPVQQIQAVISE